MELRNRSCPQVPRWAPVLNEGAKRGASQCGHRLTHAMHRSSTKVRSVELRNMPHCGFHALPLASSTKVRSVELRNFRCLPSIRVACILLNEGAKRGASQCHGVVPLAGAGQSSTKVRSVELRNLRMFHLPTMCDIPQRRCEAWSFAISPTGSGVISGLNPQRRCEAWSFAMSSRR